MYHHILKKAISKHQLINTADDDALYRQNHLIEIELNYMSVLDDLSENMDINKDTVKPLKAFISMMNIKIDIHMDIQKG